MDLFGSETEWLDELIRFQRRMKSVSVALYASRAGVHSDWHPAAIFSPNHIYYPIITFGVHRIGAAITYAFSFTLDRLLF